MNGCKFNDVSDNQFTTICGHTFHKDCIEKYATSQTNEYLEREFITCPTCQCNLLTSDELKDVAPVNKNDFNTCCSSMWLPNDVANDYEWALKSRLESILDLLRDKLYPSRVVTRAYFARKEATRQALIKRLDDADATRAKRRTSKQMFVTLNAMRAISGMGALVYCGSDSDSDSGDYYDDFGAGHYMYNENEEWVLC